LGIARQTSFFPARFYFAPILRIGTVGILLGDWNGRSESIVDFAAPDRCRGFGEWRQGEHMADEDLQSELARLRAENEALKQKRSNAVSLKVSEKGAVSVYGLGRFPVTLYQEQWQKLLALTDEIKAFIEENRSKLKVKE
jgi:hypothetical protein